MLHFVGAQTLKVVLWLVCFFFNQKGMEKKSPVLKNKEKETGIIRAAVGIKEVNVITATSAREVVLLLLLFIR